MNPVVTAVKPVESHETFFARVEPWMAPSDILRLKTAYMIAKAGHRFQTRKEVDENGKPLRYFDHVRNVAIYLLDTLHVTDCNTVISGLLHDTLEDTRITQELIEHNFGKQVVQNVKLLSKCPKEGYYQRLLAFGNPNVWLVKLSDRIDNLSSLSQLSPEFKQRQKKDTMEHIFPIVDALEAATRNTPDAATAQFLRVTLRGLVMQLEK